MVQEDRELFLCAQKGDEDAKDELFSRNIGLVHHVVKRFMGRGCETEDLFQLGSIGLIKAIDRFDVDYGVCFSTYAVPMIVGEIRRFLRDDGILKVSRSIKENIWKLRQTRERLNQTLGRDVTVQELSKESGIPVEDIVVAMDADHDVESIYKKVYQSDGNEIYLVDMLGNDSSKNAVLGTSRNEGEELLNKMLIDEILEKLDKKERLLIKLRYYENQTQTQVAQELGMSQVQVSRLEKKVLLRMRDAI